MGRRCCIRRHLLRGSSAIRRRRQHHLVHHQRTARNGYATDTYNVFGEGAGADLGGQAMIVNISWDATYVDANCNTGCNSSSPQFITETASIGGNLITITTQDSAASKTPGVVSCLYCNRGDSYIQVNGPYYNSAFLTAGYHFIQGPVATTSTNPVDSESAILALLAEDQAMGDGFIITVGNSSATATAIQGVINFDSNAIVNTSTPEPATWVLFGTSLALIGVFGRKCQA